MPLPRSFTCCSVELGFIFHGLCRLDKCLTLSDINKAMYLFWGRITVKRTHKPVHIKIPDPGHVLAPPMKAVCYMLKNFPIAVGIADTPKNKQWKFLLHLFHLVDLIFALHFTQEMSVYTKHIYV